MWAITKGLTKKLKKAPRIVRIPFSRPLITYKQLECEKTWILVRSIWIRICVRIVFRSFLSAFSLWLFNRGKFRKLTSTTYRELTICYLPETTRGVKHTTSTPYLPEIVNTDTKIKTYKRIILNTNFYIRRSAPNLKYLFWIQFRHPCTYMTIIFDRTSVMVKTYVENVSLKLNYNLG